MFVSLNICLFFMVRAPEVFLGTFSVSYTSPELWWSGVQSVSGLTRPTYFSGFSLGRGVGLLVCCEKWTFNPTYCLNWLPEAVISVFVFLDLLYFDSPDQMSLWVSRMNSNQPLNENPSLDAHVQGAGNVPQPWRLNSFSTQKSSHGEPVR